MNSEKSLNLEKQDGLAQVSVQLRLRDRNLQVCFYEQVREIYDPKLRFCSQNIIFMSKTSLFLEIANNLINV